MQLKYKGHEDTIEKRDNEKNKEYETKEIK